MQQTLPLDLPAPLLASPFTRAEALAIGVLPASVDRMLREGRLRRLLRGVYVDAALDLTPALRAAALALVLRPGAVLVDRTAAWVHGLGDLVGLGELPALDVLGRPRRGRRFAAVRPLGPGDLAVVGGLRLTTPVRTVCDLGRVLGLERGLAVLDGAQRRQLVTMRDLSEQLPRQLRLPGGTRLRHLLTLTDDRAESAAASVLRLRWYDAGLPTPVPMYPTAPGPLTLAVPAHGFGVRLGAGAPVPGWDVLALAETRVLTGDAELLQAHLRRAFHRRLMSEVS